MSIITPTYNHEKYIGACIDSVLHQTYENWEQIILDDGSTDETPAVIRRYADPRIHYIYQNNVGIEALAHTYNRALEHCRGPLIAILEGDDTWPPDKLNNMVNAFSDPSVVLAYGEMREIGADGKQAKRITRAARIRRSLPQRVLFNDPPPAAAAHMLTFYGHSLIPASTVVIRRFALEAIGGFQYVPRQCYVDFPTFIRLSTQGRFYCTSEVVGYRRMHSSSATARLMKEMLETATDFRRQLMKDPSFALTEIDRARIEESWRSVEHAEEFALGRMRLLEGRWEQSRSHFLSALGSSDFRVTAGATAGWVLSWLRCNLEVLFRLAGRASLREIHK